MTQSLRRAASAAILIAAAGATPATAEDEQVSILAGGLRVPIEFWWKCVDDPGSNPDSTSNDIYMCEDSEGWLVLCAGDPTESACYLFPPGEHPGPGGRATTGTASTGTATPSAGSGFGTVTGTNGQLQLAR